MRKTVVLGLILPVVLAAVMSLLKDVAWAVELRLTDDTQTNSAQPNTILNSQPGSVANLRVSATRNSYVKFDLGHLPGGLVGSDVAKATLKLWADTVTTAGSFEVRRVTTSWDEETLTWNTNPTVGGLEGTGSATQALSFVSVDVTQVVKDWLDGTAPHGLALLGIGGVDVTFDSKEDLQRGHEPQLEVVLAGDITAVTAGTGLSGGGTKGDVTLSVDTSQIQKRVNISCALGSSIRVIDATGGVTCQIDNNSGGTITGVTAGSGLTGGGTSGGVTVGVASAGITTDLVADAAVTTTKLAANSVDGSKIVDGSVGSADVNSGQVQLRVGGTCAAGNAIRVVNSDGTVTCEASGGLGGSGTEYRVAKFTAASTLGNSAISEIGGYVGIGTTQPERALQIERNCCWGGGIQVRNSAAGGGAYSLLVGDTAGYEGKFFIYQEGAGFRLTINPSGNVGIGTIYPSTALDVNGTITGTTKNFQIAHPVEPERKLLVHSALEGPEVGVYYRGETQLVNGQAEIVLPAYFEALTRKEGRTVHVTPVGGWAPLYVAAGVEGGKFTVRADGGSASQRFYWEVKAVRADVAPLAVERLKAAE